MLGATSNFIKCMVRYVRIAKTVALPAPWR